MSHSSQSGTVRIGIKLDSTMAMEALITHRLLELPKPRRQEWLRTLLIKGFIEECAELRRLQRDSSGATSTSYVPREQSKPCRARTCAKADELRVVDEPTMPSIPAPPMSLPLTALRAVVG